MKRKREPIRLLHTWIQGAVGHDFVIKHYKYGPVKTKFPDMTKIIASAHQRKCRNLFKEAVDYARSVYADPIKKKAWTNKSRKKHRVFNYIIKEYMLAAKEAAYQREKIGTIIIRKCFSPGSGRLKTVRPLSPGPSQNLQSGRIIALKRLTALSRPDT